MFAPYLIGIVYCVWILLIGGKELEKLKIEEEEKDKILRDEQRKTANLIDEKGKHFASPFHFYCWRLATSFLFGLLVNMTLRANIET